MQRLFVKKLRSLARRNISQSTELQRGNKTSSGQKLPPSTASHEPHGGHQMAEILSERSPFSRHSISQLRRDSVSYMRNDCYRRFSSISGRDDVSLEEDVEKKAGWLLKLIFVATASVVGYQFFPHMGDNLLQQSISLLHVKDPLFKRMGASRLSRYAVDDKRRMKVVEFGGAQELLNMLEAAKDDKTRKEALKALFALSFSDEAADVLHRAGALEIIEATPESAEFAEVGKYRLGLLTKFQGLGHDTALLGEKGL